MSVSVALDAPTGQCSVLIPKQIHTCFSYILKHGETKGIFRVSGSVKRVNALTKTLIDNPDYDLDAALASTKPATAESAAGSVAKVDATAPIATATTTATTTTTSTPAPQPVPFTIHDVATVVKRLLSHFLRDTDAVVVNNCAQLAEIQALCAEIAQESPDATLSQQASTRLVTQTCSIIDIPRANLNLLLYFTHHLKKLATLDSTTQMSVSDLAIIFQPHFFNSSGVVDPNKYKTFKAAIEAYINHNDILIEKLSPKLRASSSASARPTVKVRIVSTRVPVPAANAAVDSTSASSSPTTTVASDTMSAVSTATSNTVVSDCEPASAAPAVKILPLESPKKSPFLKRAFSMRVKKITL